MVVAQAIASPDDEPSIKSYELRTNITATFTPNLHRRTSRAAPSPLGTYNTLFLCPWHRFKFVNHQPTSSPNSPPRSTTTRASPRPHANRDLLPPSLLVLHRHRGHSAKSQHGSRRSASSCHLRPLRLLRRRQVLVLLHRHLLLLEVCHHALKTQEAECVASDTSQEEFAEANVANYRMPC